MNLQAYINTNFGNSRIHALYHVMCKPHTYGQHVNCPNMVGKAKCSTPLHMYQHTYHLKTVPKAAKEHKNKTWMI